MAKILVLKILWAGLTFSQLAYVLAAYFLFPGTAEGGAPATESVPGNLWLPAAIAGLVALAFYLSRLTTGRVDDLLKGKGTERGLQTLMVTFLVAWALNEVVTLVGFVLVVLQRQPGQIVPYAAAGIVLNLIMFPRVDDSVRRALARENQT